MEEAGFQKVPEDMTQQQQAEFPVLWELHWDKRDLEAVLFWFLGLTGADIKS